MSRGGVGRTYLGSPQVPVSATKAYLRQRLVAQGELRARRDWKWRKRIWVAGLLTAFYILIGRDLLGVVVGWGGNASMSIRKGVHTVAVGLKKAAEAREKDKDLCSPLPGDGGPVAPPEH